MYYKQVFDYTTEQIKQYASQNSNLILGEDTVKEIAIKVSGICTDLIDILKLNYSLLKTIITAIQSDLSLNSYYDHYDVRIEAFAHLQNDQLKTLLLNMAECAFDLKALQQGDVQKTIEIFNEEMSTFAEENKMLENNVEIFFAKMLQNIIISTIDYLSKIIEKQIKTEEKESLISLSESLQNALTVTHKNSNNAKMRP